ncbi:MAG: hypothetical protein P1V20_24630 [Verrucomicrobiales bacterium]|nr:hypothetical protein [Verrucomicrobiales bacterium]
MILDHSPEVCGEEFREDWPETARLYSSGHVTKVRKSCLPDYAVGERG